MLTWQATDLSVDPPSWQMADGDLETFDFDAEEAINAATAELVRIDTLATAGTVSEVSIVGDVASVTVSALERGVSYELSMTFTASAAGNRKWTRTLVLLCVA